METNIEEAVTLINQITDDLNWLYADIITLRHDSLVPIAGLMEGLANNGLLETVVFPGVEPLRPSCLATVAGTGRTISVVCTEAQRIEDGLKTIFALFVDGEQVGSWSSTARVGAFIAACIAEVRAQKQNGLQVPVRIPVDLQLPYGVGVRPEN